ncbi:hypothetical protein [Polaromonas sp.]|uniref:Uncharacterized protein n=1 Tax=Polaromonas aquatica TaxID=332657 RepID=A0ABW1U7L6_9BURK
MASNFEVTFLNLEKYVMKKSLLALAALATVGAVSAAPALWKGPIAVTVSAFAVRKISVQA